MELGTCFSFGVLELESGGGMMDVKEIEMRKGERQDSLLWWTTHSMTGLQAKCCRCCGSED